MSSKCNGCNEIPHCNEYSTGCDKPVDATCVEYGTTPSQLNCFVPIPSGTKLDRILEIWEQKLCETVGVNIISCVKEKLNIPTETFSLTPSGLLTKIQEWICNYSDEKVKVTSGDASTGYLLDKIEQGECILVTMVKDPVTGIEKVKISIDKQCIASAIPQCFQIEVPQCYEIDNGGLPCIPQPTVPVISRIGLTLNGSNCNGAIQWYNSNNQLIGSGTSIIVDGGTTYYAKCTTSCGTSQASVSVNVPVISTYTSLRKAIFIKECNVNPCNIPCVGTTIEYSKSYSSNISQDDANSKSENDVAFALEGQAKVNAEGTCVCPDCNCVFPTYNNNIVVTDSTCSGQVINANGQVLIVGIANADKFGFSIGSGGYTGVSYQDAITLNNYNQGNIETTPSSIRIKGLSIETRLTVRMFNSSNNCFKDVIITLTPPDCTQEQVSIINAGVVCLAPASACKRYSITAGGGNGAKYWFQDCATLNYSSDDIIANGTIQICSKVPVQVTNGVATLIGDCA